MVAQYVYLDGHRAVARIDGPEVYGIHGDHLGTPRVMVDSRGLVVWRATHTPFGRTAISLETVPLPHRA